VQTGRSERQVIAFLAFILALLAFGIDIVLPSFDRLRDEFGLGAGSGEVSLVITFYFFGMAGGQVLYGPFSDRFGRRPVLVAGLSVYALGALGATLAPGMEVLLGARFVWGVGAASCAVLYTAIARDLYEGDQMARVMQLVAAVFLIGPMVAPSIGELLLLTGWWRSVFAVGVILALVAALWATAFGETLAAQDRRPLQFSETARAFGSIFRTRKTLGLILALTFSNGAFFIYLGSGQPIIDEIYGYGDWFALIFGTMAIFISIGLYFASRLTVRIGAEEMASRASLGTVAASILFLIVAFVTDGRPSFFVWYGVAVVALAFMTVINPTCISLALQPMGKTAGTAAGVLGLVSQGGGALLAALFDRQIDQTVTPMAVAFVLYGSISAGFVAWALRASVPEVAARQ
jgi:DHA1 family bicyclomycin/chloramphenicol resistance-like MFS transporter